MRFIDLCYCQADSGLSPVRTYARRTHNKKRTQSHTAKEFFFKGGKNICKSLSLGSGKVIPPRLQCALHLRMYQICISQRNCYFFVIRLSANPIYLLTYTMQKNRSGKNFFLLTKISRMEAHSIKGGSGQF